MKILNVTTSDLPKIIAGLAREGVMFQAWEASPGNWTIELTGGF